MAFPALGLPMTKSGVAGVGYAPDMATYTAIYQPAGWVLSSTPSGVASYEGATSGGAPATGSYVVGDFITDANGDVWTCTVAGSPGTWLKVGDGASFWVGGDQFAATGTGSPSLATGLYYPAWLLDPTTIEQVACQWRTPTSWLTATVTLWYYNPSSGTGVARMNPKLKLKGSGEDITGADASGITSTVDITAPAIGIIGTISCGTYTCDPAKVAGFMLQRNASSGSDTLANDIGIIGVTVAKAS